MNRKITKITELPVFEDNIRRADVSLECGHLIPATTAINGLWQYANCCVCGLVAE